MAAQPPEFKVDTAELIRRARGGDGNAYGGIVNLYRNRVISYCYRMAGGMAEDLAQEIFVKFYLALDRFDPSKPIGPFLFRIAHNHCVDALKKKRIQSIPLLGGGEKKRELQIRDDRPNPEESIQNAELKHAIHEALVQIPVRYRSPLVMWHVEGLSYAEISEVLDLPMGTVKARIHRGRRMVQQKMSDFVCINGEGA